MPRYKEEEHDVAWDCDPTAHIVVEEYDTDLDEEDDTGDLQVLVLDRFGDRMVNPGLYTRRNEFAERAAELAEEARLEQEFVRNHL